MTLRVFVLLSALPALALVPVQTVKTDPARVSVMHEQLRMVSTIQTAVVQGDLAAVEKAARALADRPLAQGVPEKAAPHVAAISTAARAAAAAADVTTAAIATSRMLAACGTCHRAVGTMPALASPALPSVGGTVGHMLEHQRASDQLLHGLVVPSQTAWREGAQALRAAPLHARELPRDAKLTPELLRVEEAVHRLAEDALAADTTDARVRVYSTLLARCADCHGLHRRVWGPPPR